MEKSISELTVDSIKDKYYDYLIIPKREKELRLLYDTYKSSPDTLNLLSEQNRTLFADHLLLDEPKNVVRKLYWMTIDFIVTNFNGNAKEIDKHLDEVTKRNIWELVDINLPLLQTVDITSEVYWQRVFDEKSRNRFKIGQDTTNNLNLSMKCLGMSERVKEIFEEQSYEGWVDDIMIEMVKPLKQYIYHLRITQLVPIKEYTYDRGDTNLIDYRMINYREDECHHINLGIVGEFNLLTYLSFEFTPPILGHNYQSRYFDFSTLDMTHLANGLKRLNNLTTFKIRNSRMNNKKLEILVDGLASCPLENVDFSYCQLNDDCGYTLCKLLQHTDTLQTLELSGNYLSTPGMSSLCYGIQEFEGNLKELNLARNPVNDSGLMFLARALFQNPNQIEKLNICGIQINFTGCSVIPKLLEHSILNSINICALPIGEIIGEDIISSLQSNRNIRECVADECDLTLEQEFKISILIKRNNYIYENPYIDSIDISYITPSTENIPDLEVKKIKNKIYLKALDTLEKYTKCNEILTENYKNNIPNVIHYVGRDSVETANILTATVPKIPSTMKIFRVSDIHFYNQFDEPEKEFVKNCVFSKTTDQQYFVSLKETGREHK